MRCCFCKKDAGDFGHNALPVMDGRCCSKCNTEIVLPIRILRATNSSLLIALREADKAKKELRRHFKNGK